MEWPTPTGIFSTSDRDSLTTTTTVTKEDIQNHFKDGTGNITEIKLMNGFGFIEYDDALDARDVVPGKLSIPIGTKRLYKIFADAFIYSFPYV